MWGPVFLPIFFPPGHKGDRGGLPSPRPHGLPAGPAPANAGLLAERPSRASQVRPDRQHPGQDDPQPQHLEDAGGDVYEVRQRQKNKTKKTKKTNPEKTELFVRRMVQSVRRMI